MALISCKPKVQPAGTQIQSKGSENGVIMEGVGCSMEQYQKMNAWVRDGDACDGEIYRYLDVVLGCGLKKDSLAIVVRKAIRLGCSMEKSPAVIWFLRDNGEYSLADSLRAKLERKVPQSHSKDVIKAGK